MGTPPSDAPAEARQQAPARSLVPPASRAAGVERFDDAIVVTRARAWIGLGACLALLAGVVLWAAVATVNRTVTGSGVLLINGTITRVGSPATGTLVSWVREPGRLIRPSQVLGWVETRSGRRVAVRAPVAGRILDLEVGPGASVTNRQGLASLSAAHGPVGVYAFFPPSSAQLVALGMRAIVAFPTGETAHGRVTLVGRLPLSRGQIASAIGSPALARMVAPDGAVTVAVTPARFSVTPARFSAAHSQAGPGDVASVTVIVGSSHPISYVF